MIGTSCYKILKHPIHALLKLKLFCRILACEAPIILWVKLITADTLRLPSAALLVPLLFCTNTLMLTSRLANCMLSPFCQLSLHTTFYSHPSLCCLYSHTTFICKLCNSCTLSVFPSDDNFLEGSIKTLLQHKSITLETFLPAVFASTILVTGFFNV